MLGDGSATQRHGQALRSEDADPILAATPASHHRCLATVPRSGGGGVAGDRERARAMALSTAQPTPGMGQAALGGIPVPSSALPQPTPRPELMNVPGIGMLTPEQYQYVSGQVQPSLVQPGDVAGGLAGSMLSPTGRAILASERGSTKGVTESELDEILSPLGTGKAVAEQAPQPVKQLSDQATEALQWLTDNPGKPVYGMKYRDPSAIPGGAHSMAVLKRYGLVTTNPETQQSEITEFGRAVLSRKGALTKEDIARDFTRAMPAKARKWKDWYDSFDEDLNAFVFRTGSNHLKEQLQRELGALPHPTDPEKVILRK